jgi:[protein]-arginine 3-hydroxylase / protease
VPVETGTSYLSQNSGTQLMTIFEFIRRYIATSDHDKTGGYLAQHELLAQIPRLHDDIEVPDYCSFLHDDHDEDSDEFLKVSEHVWFGPNNTQSPLHFDGYHNVLVQVVGKF